MSVLLTKTKYCEAIQCPKMLWMELNKGNLFQKTEDLARLDVINEVVPAARTYFGDFTQIPRKSPRRMTDLTKKAISENREIIADASFLYNKLYAKIDILRNLGNKTVEIYEIKGTTGVKPLHLESAAFLYLVLQKLGYNVAKVGVIHINHEYVRGDEVSVKELLTVADITEEAVSGEKEAEKNIRRFLRIVRQKEEPETDIGESCFSPYDCGFFRYCGRNLPSPSVFNLAGVALNKKVDLYRRGIVDFPALAKCKELGRNQSMQIEHEIKSRQPLIEKEKIAEFLSMLTYPLYFLDFESFQPAIPLFKDTSPFEQIVFQYSLHYIEKEGAPLRHREFLAEAGEDPRRRVAEKLCKDIPKDVCVLAYNMGFEKGRIRELAELCPDLAPHLMNIHHNIRDLMTPFEKKYYYCRGMEGSYSIKHVLPALFPHDPALDYHNLNGVHNGAEAARIYNEMWRAPKSETLQYRDSLLKYCGLDTLAMVKIWEKLKETVK